MRWKWPRRGPVAPFILLEKDVWVVWTLKALFASDFADHSVCT